MVFRLYAPTYRGGEGGVPQAVAASVLQNVLFSRLSKQVKKECKYQCGINNHLIHHATSLAITPPQAQATANQLITSNISTPHLLHIANALSVLDLAAVNVFTARRNATLIILCVEVNASSAS